MTSFTAPSGSSLVSNPEQNVASSGHCPVSPLVVVEPLVVVAPAPPAPVVVPPVVSVDVELELEIDRGIIEAAHGRERNFQFLGHVGEGQANLEAGVGHLQVPILELDDDGHLLGIALAQPRRHAHAGRAGQEGDEEVVVAGKAGACDLGQDLAHDAAQRLLGQNVVADVVVGHVVVGFR